jgi:hypothetical protein
MAVKAAILVPLDFALKQTDNMLKFKPGRECLANKRMLSKHPRRGRILQHKEITGNCGN